MFDSSEIQCHVRCIMYNLLYVYIGMTKLISRFLLCFKINLVVHIIKFNYVIQNLCGYLH